ncbi:MAG TPA: phospholipid carrier-dependent glycosyltransferase [Oceanobacillus sp.]|nr:phospholipid carrier-dependent glycosyltransferase [Oceanobacillus sp.]
MNRTYRLLDGLFLVALALFVLAGTPLASFHGDEPMQIYMSGDYEVALVQGNPSALMTNPPYFIDTDPQLRILNGTINRYAIGFARTLAGIGADQLPPRPGWDWGLNYDDNVSTGHRPSEALMLAGRLPSSLFLAASVFVMFGLARQFGNRPFAYLVTALYTLNPIILLNGRRAMQEGSLLFFGLLVILIAAVIARRRANGESTPLYLWIGLILGGALTLASKHNGVVFMVGALGWIFVGELTHFRLREVALTTIKLLVSSVLIAGLFLALSPALWNDPVARFGDLLAVRAELLDIQVAADPLAPMPFEQRVQNILTQPFLTPLAHYEVAAWADFAPITAEITQYMNSPLSGLQFGQWIGLVLTILAGLGIIVLFVPRLRPYHEWASSWGLLVWLVVTCASLFANPLPWQRYYLPLIPIVTLLAGIGLMALARAFGLIYRKDARLM